MKNKFLISLLLYVIISFEGLSLANNFIFDTSEIQVLENGDLVSAKNGIATSQIDNLQIKANIFQYRKKIPLLTATGSAVATSLKDSIQIKADKLKYNELTSILTASGNVEIKDLNKNFLLKSNNIFYNTKLKIIKSETPSEIQDDLGNNTSMKNFIFLLEDNLVKINSAIITDVQKNTTRVDKAYIDLNLNKIAGKDVSIDFDNNSAAAGNEPRIKGKSILVNEKSTTIDKAVFTTCKKNDDCPPWQMFAKEIKHDKEKKTINYKDAWLKIYDTPIFYFPKFFHPDPTVKRQSGFLMPSFNQSTSLGTSFNIPYYKVFSESRDATLTPRLYNDNKLLLQSEYRQVNKKSYHTYDFSVLTEENKPSKSHFFSMSKFNLALEKFEESELNLQVQQASNDTYLKTYKLKSPIIDDQNLLTSSLGFSAYRERLSFDLNFKVYEDLSKKNNDRYEYIYPNYNLVEKFQDNEKLNGAFTMDLSGFQKYYNTDVYEQVSINNLTFDSNSKITDLGFRNNFNILLKNVNSKSRKSNNYKEDRDAKIKSLAQYNVTFPLKKQMQNNYTHLLKPIMAIKYSPSNTKNMSQDSKRLDMSNIFSLNRISSNDTVEGGASLTYGSEFSRFNDSDKEILGVKIANVLRFDENKDLPTENNLGAKTSDIIAGVNYSPNDYLKFNYDLALDNNLRDNNYELIGSEFKVNNFVTNFEYLNENNTIEKASYLSNKTSYAFNNSTNLSFATRKNKKTSLTEFYNLIYEYRNDCLVAGIEYNKDYYSDRDLRAEENIFFKLTIIPIGQTNSPNLIK